MTEGKHLKQAGQWAEDQGQEPCPREKQHDWQTGVLVLIFRKAGHKVSSNYQGITLLSPWGSFLQEDQTDSRTSDSE